MARLKAKQAEQNNNQQEMFFIEHRKDYNPYYSSTLFSDVYIRNDLPREYKHLWENDEIGGFYHFYNEFVNLCHATESLPFESLKEQDTVTKWIVPVMELLGWENKSTKFAKSFTDNTSFVTGTESKKQTYRPDLIYYEQPSHLEYTLKENKDSEAKLAAARDEKFGAKIVIEAKYWDRLSAESFDKKRDKGESDSASAYGPEIQTLKYMELLNLPFGILTDGKTWKLLHRELSQGVDCRNFKFDLGKLKELALDLGSGLKEQEFRKYAKYFYYFFSKESLATNNDSKTLPLMFQILEYSKKYAHSIEDDLRKRFIITMGITCNALKNSCIKNKETIDLETIRNVAESHLFNILFVKSCEVRGILPIKTTNYLKVSLHLVIELLTDMKFDPHKHIDDFYNDFKRSNLFDPKKFSYDGFEIFDRFINLYEIIHDGTNKNNDFGFEIQGFKESIFSKQEWSFAKKHKISNRDMINILFNLNFIESQSSDRKYQQIPYSYFTSRQLGSIYESFLEYRLERATSDLIFTKGQWVEANLRSQHVKKLNLIDQHVVTKGQLFFSPDNEERKMSGSYYTPDFIVKYIVEKTLSPLTHKKSSDELLKLKVIDTAMGSGHFLVGALEYLVTVYRERWAEENHDDLTESITSTSRRILDACIYGVDLNPRAVKLAKMSMWLITAEKGLKLERLEDQLKSGDSLVSNLKGYEHNFSFKEAFPKILFDAVIGNPPWISFLGRHKAKSFTDEYVNHVVSKYSLDTNRPNIYEAFIRLGLNLIKNKPASRFGVIVPDRLGLNQQFGELRKNILEEYRLESVTYKMPFEGIIADTGIFIISNELPRETFEGTLYPESPLTVNIKSIKNDPLFAFNFANSTGYNFEKLKAESVELVNGGLSKSFVGLIAKSGSVQKTRTSKNEIELLKGRDISRFSVLSSHFFNFKKENMVGGTQDVGKLSQKNKILLRKTGDFIQATLAKDGQFIEQSLYALYDFKGIDPILLVCYLNSNLLTNYYLSYLCTNKDSTPQLKKIHLDVIPVPVKFLNKHSEALTTIYKKIMKEGFSEVNQKALNKIFDRFLSRSDSQKTEKIAS